MSVWFGSGSILSVSRLFPLLDDSELSFFLFPILVITVKTRDRGSTSVFHSVLSPSFLRINVESSNTSVFRHDRRERGDPSHSHVGSRKLKSQGPFVNKEVVTVTLPGQIHVFVLQFLVTK